MVQKDKGFNIVVINSETNGAISSENCLESYQPLPLDSATISIGWLKVGGGPYVPNEDTTSTDPDPQPDEFDLEVLEDPEGHRGFYSIEDGSAIYDDFAISHEYSSENGGLYWWRSGEHSDNGFEPHVSLNRVDSLSALLATVNQDTGTSNAFGVTFGQNEDLKRVIDFSEETFDYSMAVTNTSNYDISCYLIAVDSNDNVIDIDSSWYGEPLDDGWKYMNALSIPAGETKVFEKDATGLGGAQLSGTFKGGFHVDYSADSNECTPDRVEDFNPEIVSGFKIVVTNRETNGGILENCYENYQPLPLDSATIAIHWLKVGEAEPVFVGTNDQIKDRSISMYPNPAVGIQVKFEKSLTNLSVYDAQGNLIESFDKKQSLDVSNYTNGLYILKADQGTERLIVE